MTVFCILGSHPIHHPPCLAMALVHSQRGEPPRLRVVLFLKAWMSFLHLCISDSAWILTIACVFLCYFIFKAPCLFVECETELLIVSLFSTSFVHTSGMLYVHLSYVCMALLCSYSMCLPQVRRLLGVLSQLLHGWMIILPQGNSSLVAEHVRYLA